MISRKPLNTNDLIATPAFFRFRLITLFVIVGLLVPICFIGKPDKTNARNMRDISTRTNLPEAVAKPPQPFQVASSGFQLSSRWSSVVDLWQSANPFASQSLPEGLAMAKSVSPFSAFISSTGNSLGSVFGFFAFSNTESANSSLMALPGQPTGTTRFDFDGDGKADLARRRTSDSQWEIKYSLTGSTNLVTVSAGQIAPADYDGDSKTDAAVFTNGTWTILQSSNGQTVTISNFGQADDNPVSGDYDGDGVADAAVFRPANGTWYVRQSGSGNQIATTTFGAAGDIAVAGNYDGDARMDYAVFRPADGIWHFLLSSAGYGYSAFQWGLGTDIPVPADYDGDGKTDKAVYRPAVGNVVCLQEFGYRRFISGASMG